MMFKIKQVYEDRIQNEKKLFERELAMRCSTHNPTQKKTNFDPGQAVEEIETRVCSFRVKHCINCTVDSPVPGSYEEETLRTLRR